MYIGTDEARQRLQAAGFVFTRQTITLWAKHKRIESRKVGGRWFVSAAAIDAMIKGQGTPESPKVEALALAY